MDSHDQVIDINSVMMTGLVVASPSLQVVSPEATLALSFPLLVRDAFLNHTGALEPIEYRVPCLATGIEAERYVCLEEGDAIEIRGSLEMMLEHPHASGPSGYVLGVRIHELIS